MLTLVETEKRNGYEGRAVRQIPTLNDDEDTETKKKKIACPTFCLHFIQGINTTWN